MGAKDKTYSSVKLNLDYISVPVMVQYNVLPDLYVEAGPQFSFAISQKLKGDGGSVDVDQAFKGFDLGFGLVQDIILSRNSELRQDMLQDLQISQKTIR
jgi:hypothetical protein